MYGSNPLIAIKHFLVSSNMDRQLGHYMFLINNVVIRLDSCSHTINRKAVLSILSIFDLFVDMRER